MNRTSHVSRRGRGLGGGDAGALEPHNFHSGAHNLKPI